MQNKNIDRLRQIIDLKVALEQRNLTPLKAQLQQLTETLKNLDAQKPSLTARTDDVNLNLAYQMWHENCRQNLLIKIAIAREACKLSFATVAHEKAKSSVVEKMSLRWQKQNEMVPARRRGLEEIIEE